MYGDQDCEALACDEGPARVERSALQRQRLERSRSNVLARRENRAREIADEFIASPARGDIEMADGVVQIHVTHPDRQALGRLVGELVESHAVASANIAGPLASTYFWNGKSEHAEEWLAIMKTARARVDEVVATIDRGHPYEVPGIMVLTIDGGFAPYLDWIRQTTKDARSSDL